MDKRWHITEHNWLVHLSFCSLTLEVLGSAAFGVVNMTLKQLNDEISRCTQCTDHLPFPPRPVIQVGEGARLAIIGQAPGAKVHESGIPWQDASGQHLRDWLHMDEATFYDCSKVALIPMGFCYPGKKAGGDAPPRPECAPLWHKSLLEHLPKDVLCLLVGQYAHNYYLGQDRRKTLTETVRAFEDYLPRYFALPHPSWRSRLWMKKTPWFEDAVLPELRRRVASQLR